MTRLQLQTLAIRGEVPLIPIGVTHLERQVEKVAFPPYASAPETLLGVVRPAPGPSSYYGSDYKHYIPALETVTLEVAYDKDPTETGPLVFAFLESAPVCSPFFLLHCLKVGSSVLIDDARGLHLQALSRTIRLAPARFVQGDKIVVKVQNWDCAGHAFYLGLFFAKDET